MDSFTPAQKMSQVSKDKDVALCRQSILDVKILGRMAWNGVENVKPWIVSSASSFLRLSNVRSRQGSAMEESEISQTRPAIASATQEASSLFLIRSF